MSEERLRLKRRRSIERKQVRDGTYRPKTFRDRTKYRRKEKYPSDVYDQVYLDYELEDY